MVSCVGLQCMVVVFPDHARFLEHSFILLINVKIPTVGILSYIGMTNFAAKLSCI